MQGPGTGGSEGRTLVLHDRSGVGRVGVLVCALLLRRDVVQVRVIVKRGPIYSERDAVYAKRDPIYSQRYPILSKTDLLSLTYLRFSPDARPCSYICGSGRGWRRREEAV